MRKAYKEEYIDLDLLFKIINKDPFDHNKDGLVEAKFDCAIRNGVKIIYV